MEQMAGGGFVVTSNVDGQFQRAGFPADRLVECHGRIEVFQCLSSCGADLFDADPSPLVIDLEELRAAEPLPRCPRCQGIARPNILMFGDFDWDSSLTAAQERRFGAWLSTVIDAGPVVVVECGAGTAISTIRSLCERTAEQLGGTLVRLNPRAPEVPRGHIGLPLGAAEGLDAIDRRMARLGR
jgi:NAD-dependent SIR2 family protein deacetylase